MLPFLIYIFSFSPVKYPFIKYQLALGIFEEFSRSKARGHHFTDDLLSPEGLGVPENIFSDLQVSSVHSHIQTDGPPAHIVSHVSVVT
jgi:hypothetical protein